MSPIIVPQPVRDELLEMIKPLANEWDPPTRCSVDGFVPSPTTNGRPLEMTVPEVFSVPPPKTNCPLALVTIRLSTLRMPLLNVSVPLETIKSADLLLLVTLRFAPAMRTSDVETEELPTTKFEETMISPPANDMVLIVEFVALRPTSRPSARTCPPLTFIWPIPSLPTQMVELIVIRYPPVIRSCPVAPL